MSSLSSHCFTRLASRLPRLRWPSAFALAAVVATGCGGGGGAGTNFSGNTQVTVLTTSTANDQLTEFGGALNTLTLTSQSGNRVSLLTSPAALEFIHVNGRTEPLVTVSVPQGIYTSATITTMGYTGFGCSTLENGYVSQPIWAYSSVPSSNITVTLPKPITITGTSLGLLLDLLVSKSAIFGSCDGSVQAYSITPAFTITPVAFVAQPTNSQNGKLSGLRGVVASINSDGSGISVNPLGGGPISPIWQAMLNGSTAFQGIAGASQLAVGLPVELDVTAQPDGSLLATRVEVYDTDTANLSFWYGGPLLKVSSADPEVIVSAAMESMGPIVLGFGSWFDFGGTRFQISKQLINLANLPFQTSFTAANMVAGQNVAVTMHDTSVGPNGPSATTITLIPQTINGTVNEISTEGEFTTFVVQLAPYDVFPTFATQPNQTTVLTNPNTVVVYADSNTQKLNTIPIAVGSVARFYGLVFNDNGTLRMDCAQINDGVAE
ncbi:MAG: hypothetical protein ACLGRW_14365 [Acidobacteriota bacterium]